MSINLDDDILQDFLVEAGEIVEKLGEQLVSLEQSPRDSDLLNAVFRGFHTVKGGAGFLGLTALVAVCHRAEDVFNILRQGKRHVDAGLMDVVLVVLDVVKDMMDVVRAGEEPSPADPALLAKLDGLSQPKLQEASPPQEAAQSKQATQENNPVNPPLLNAGVNDKKNISPSELFLAKEGEITDDEFEALLDQLQGKDAPVIQQVNAGAPPLPGPEIANSDIITDDEFEAILDVIHGKKPDAPSVVSPPAIESKPVEKPVAEHAPAPPKDVPQVETTVRVDTKRLDDIMNLVGELVLVRNRLSTLKSSMAQEEAIHVIGNLDLVTSDLQNAVMKTRMQPIKKVFGRFPRVVRDLARTLNKEISLELHGEDTDLDKNLVEALADPLVHLVRNAVDHGVEIPEVRVAAGKPREGKIILSAQQEGDHILLVIQDDGAGIDPEVLRNKVVEKGLMDMESAARLDDRGCFNLIFLPGFSTKNQISDVSGRGVGMDVVKTRISQLNGAVEIDSVLGKGSKFIIKLPLTLAIMPTLMVLLDNQAFAMPLVNVSEIFNLGAARTNTVDGQMMVIVRNKAIPLYYLREWLVKGPARTNRPTAGYVVVINIAEYRIACVVEQLIGQEEVVIKPLGALLHGTRGFAGATITGNGRIALILDFSGLMKSYIHH
jgi:two-component system chemotaxis sensor kinase CheA